MIILILLEFLGLIPRFHVKKNLIPTIFPRIIIKEKGQIFFFLHIIKERQSKRLSIWREKNLMMQTNFLSKKLNSFYFEDITEIRSLVSFSYFQPVENKFV